MYLNFVIKIRTDKGELSCNNSVGIATRYGLDGLGIEARRRKDFPYPYRPWGPPTLLYSGYRVSLSERGVNHPSQSSAEVKEIVELYLCPSWAFMVCSGTNFTLNDRSTSYSERALEDKMTITMKNTVLFVYEPHREKLAPRM